MLGFAGLDRRRPEVGFAGMDKRSIPRPAGRDPARCGARRSPSGSRRSGCARCATSRAPPARLSRLERGDRVRPAADRRRGDRRAARSSAIAAAPDATAQPEDRPGGVRRRRRQHGHGRLVQPGVARRAAPARDARAPARPARGRGLRAADLQRRAPRAGRRGRRPAHARARARSIRRARTVSTAKLRELTEAALAARALVPRPAPGAGCATPRSCPLRADALQAYAPASGRAGRRSGARERLAFEELLVLLFGLARRRQAADEGAVARRRSASPASSSAATRARCRSRYTPEQEAAIADLDRDLARETPMQRLLQGDVGSGKTVVALYALLRAVENGHQGALMAPTETLAEQHFLTIEGSSARSACAPACSPARSRPSSTRRRARQVASGEAQLVVGTHALIQEHVAFRSLAVAVVDEQHRFGVEQRRALTGDAERVPHVLHMTATPIPRTLAQTVYGDLDVTEIAQAAARPQADQHGLGRRTSAAPRRTRGCGATSRTGRQAYVVCPLVSESRDDRGARGRGRGRAAPAAPSCAASASAACTEGLPTAERRAVMDAFKRRELDVLVATTVIEVGVDVPNATIMIVQEADRFGLAQLHQLRGRVGRGAEQSYCLLVSRPKEELTEAAQAAAPGARRHDRRVRARRGRPRAARRGRAARHAPVRPARPALREPRARPRADRARPAPGSPSSLDPRTGRSPPRPTGSSPMRIIAGSRKGARLVAAAGARHAADRRPRARGRVQPDRPGRGRARARPLRRLRRDGARGALARGRSRPCSSSATGGGRGRDRAQPREAPPHRGDRPARRRRPRPRGRGGGGQALRSRARRPSVPRCLQGFCPRSAAISRRCSRRPGSSSSSPTPATSPSCRCRCGRPAATARRA